MKKTTKKINKKKNQKIKERGEKKVGKNKRIFAISMAFCMLFCNTTFATPIDVVNSEKDVTYDTLNRLNGTDYFDDEDNEWVMNDARDKREITEETRVKVNIASQFTITIPKEIVIDGKLKKADYTVNVKGDIAGDQEIIVSPDETINLSSAGKSDIEGFIEQNKINFNYEEIMKNEGESTSGSVTAEHISAGEWLGKFNFNICFTNELFVLTYTTNSNNNNTNKTFSSYNTLVDYVNSSQTIKTAKISATASSKNTDLSYSISNSNIEEIDLTGLGERTITNIENTISDTTNITKVTLPSTWQEKVDETTISWKNIIEYDDESATSLPSKQSLSTISTEDLSTVVELGLAKEYFSIGDTRKIKVGSTYYTFKLLRLSGPKLSDDSGYASMYFGMIENYATCQMSTTNTNKGGYPSSRARTIASNAFSAFESDIQNLMKTVKVSCDTGGKFTEYKNTYVNEKVFIPDVGDNLPTGNALYAWTRRTTSRESITNCYYILPDNGWNLEYTEATHYGAVKLCFCI